MTKQKIPFSVVLILCLLQSLISYAQVQTPRYISMTNNSNAFYEYLPQGYPEQGVKYPVIIFVHGLGELGIGSSSSLAAVLRNGIPNVIDQGKFPVSFTSNGVTYKYIVISPQFTIWPLSSDIDNIIDYVTAHYNVDVNRIYLNGLSMGGGVVWTYVGSLLARAQRIAGIVPICGAAGPGAQSVLNIAQANLPVWATHNSLDLTVDPSNTINFITQINATPVPPTPRAKMTIFVVPTPQHDAWTKTSDPTFRENNMDIYEWMLQYKRNFFVLPVTGLIFTAQKNSASKALLQWKSMTEISNNGFNVLRSSDGVTFTGIGFVGSTAINGGGASYSFIDETPLKGTNYYRLEMLDNDGKKTYSNIKTAQFSSTVASLSFYPNPTNNQLNISLGQVSAKATLRISNAIGQVIQTQTITGSSAIVNVSKLGAGVYYAEVIISGEAPQHFQLMKK